MSDDEMSTEEREFLGLKAGERLHPILSDKEYLAAKEKARKKIDAERHANAMKQVEAEETKRLRLEEGLTTGVAAEDERVWATIDLPEWCPAVIINGEPYWHGHSYPVSVAQLRTLQEQMQSSWRAHDQTEGKSMAQMFQNKRASMINGKTGIVDNAPRRFDA